MHPTLQNTEYKVHIQEINCFEQLSAHRLQWRRLLESTPDVTFFHTPEWLQVYWKHFGHDKRLRVLLAYDGSQLVGVVPLMVATEATRAGKLRFLTYVHGHWGTMFGPVGPEPQAVLTAGLEHILAMPRDWDALEIRWAHAGDYDFLASRRPLPSLRGPLCRSVHEYTSLVDLHGTWEAYLAGRTSKWRNNLKRWKRRIAELGEVEYLRYRPRGDAHNDADPRWDLYEDCLAVTRGSWQSGSTDGSSLLHADVHEYFRDAHLAAVRAGALDLNLLYADGRPLAFVYNYRHGGRLMSLRVGYDAASSRSGAGNVLYAHVIEDSFRRGDVVYDLGPGSVDCKRHLRTELRPLYRYSHFPVRSLRPNILRLKRLLDGWRSADAVDEQAA